MRFVAKKLKAELIAFVSHVSPYFDAFRMGLHNLLNPMMDKTSAGAMHKLKRISHLVEKK